MKRSAKVVSNNTQHEIIPLSNTRTVLDMIKKESVLNFPGNQEHRERLKYTLLKWAEQDNSLDIVQFCMEFKISRQTLYDLVKNHEDFKYVFDEAKLWLGCRRRVGAINRKYTDIVFRDMYRYDSEWREVDQYNQTLKGDADANQTINVYLPPVKETGQVPVLQ